MIGLHPDMRGDSWKHPLCFLVAVMLMKWRSKLFSMVASVPMQHSLDYFQSHKKIPTYGLNKLVHISEHLFCLIYPPSSVPKYHTSWSSIPASPNTFGRFLQRKVRKYMTTKMKRICKWELPKYFPAKLKMEPENRWKLNSHFAWSNCWVPCWIWGVYVSTIKQVDQNTTTSHLSPFSL